LAVLANAFASPGCMIGFSYNSSLLVDSLRLSC
jgi:hypothetical protein